MRIVTLTTDFGTQDYYVGAMKGAMLAIAPNLQLVDLSHELPAHDVLAAAFVLRHAARPFPSDTIHLAVIDPGVGSARRPLVVFDQHHLWIGPDNGLFSFALEAPDCQVYAIENTALMGAQISYTFHGRDVFAPVAAHLAAGVPLDEVGPVVKDPVRLQAIRPQCDAHGIEGQIIHVDRFGNLVTNIAAEMLDGAVRICLGAEVVIEGVSQTYAEVAWGDTLALVGSAGMLEISVNGGCAARQLGLGREEQVRVQFERG